MPDTTTDRILETEFSEKFVDHMRSRMVVSYHKYGPVAKNSGEHLTRTIASLEKRLAAYKETGNTEFLVDVANFAMMEFMFPQHSNGHFEATDSDRSPGIVGVPINQRKTRLSGFR